MLKAIGIGVAAVLGLLALTWLVQGNDFFLYQAFAPKYEQVRRDTFEQSHAYRQGMVQNLHALQSDYIRATPVQRGGLATIVEQRVGDVSDPETLPADVRAFVACVRRSAPDYSDACAAS